MTALKAAPIVHHQAKDLLRAAQGAPLEPLEPGISANARQRRESLFGWSTTTSVIAGVLAGASR